jgi:hypothetical protein
LFDKLSSKPQEASTPSIAIMKVSFALFASFATLAVANPLPLKPDVKTLVGRADIVSVTCPAVNGNSQTTYSTRELEEAYSTAVSLLLPPPDKAKGKYGMSLSRP